MHSEAALTISPTRHRTATCRRTGSPLIKRCSNVRGATLIETVIALPLVLVCIYVIITVSVLVHARSSLSTAMTQALRLAATRGDKGLVGTDLISAVDSYQVASNGFSTIQNFISTGVAPNDAESFLNSCFVQLVYPLSALDTIPRQYLFTLIYLKESLQQSLGTTLKFPCRPLGSSGPTASACANLRQTAGCAGCYLLHPISLDFSQITTTDPSTERIAIRCEYAPASIFIDPLIKLFELFGGNGTSSPFTIHRDLVFEVTRLGE